MKNGCISLIVIISCAMDTFTGVNDTLKNISRWRLSTAAKVIQKECQSRKKDALSQKIKSFAQLFSGVRGGSSLARIHSDANGIWFQFDTPALLNMRFWKFCMQCLRKKALLLVKPLRFRIFLVQWLVCENVYVIGVDFCQEECRNCWTYVDHYLIVRHAVSPRTGCSR